MLAYYNIIIVICHELPKDCERKRNIRAEAVRQFMATKTYSLLFDKESYLYLESYEYVLDMLQSEEKGNWDEWLEV